MKGMDALSISSGPDRGEAAVLGRSNAPDIGRMILGEKMRARDKAEQENAQFGALINRDLESKWTSDNINYFIPKIQELKKEIVDTYKKNGNKLNELERYEFQNRFQKLQMEADASNALYAEEQDRIKQLGGDPQFKKYDRESGRIREMWNNPQKYFADEIQAAGGIIPWRMKHSQDFENLGAYSMEEHLGDVLKDKVSEWYSRDEKGKLKSYTDPKTGLIVIEGRKGIDPDKLAGHVKTFYNDPKDWRSQRMRENATNWVDENFTISDIGVTPQSELAIEVFKNSKNLKGLPLEQQKQVLAEQYVVESAKKRFPETEVVKTEKPLKIENNLSSKSGSGGGGGGYTPENFTWSYGIENKPTPKMSEKTVMALTPNMPANTGYSTRLKVATEAVQKYIDQNASKYSGYPYVAIQFKDGKDNPSLTYQGKEYISTGFVRKNNQWFLVANEPIRVEENKQEKNKGGVGPKVHYELKEIPLTADVAAKHGFGGKNAIPNMIQFLNSQAPQDF